MFRIGKAAFLGGLFVLSAAGTAAAQNVSPQIVIPENPGGGPDAGCYQVQGDLYGPYSMSFCLGNSNSEKTYNVSGGGLDCNGRLDWYRSGSGRLQINLREADCTRGQLWSADTMTCNFGNIGGPVPLSGGGEGIQPQVVIPDRPNYGNVLRCTYDPSVEGYPTTQITARRIG
jgi:hypothetical protein